MNQPICKDCGPVDPPEINKSTRNKSGYQTYCKKCKNKRRHEYNPNVRRDGVIEDNDIPLILALAKLGISNREIARKFDTYAKTIEKIVYKKNVHTQQTKNISTANQTTQSVPVCTR